jgi:hypothetical protein
MGRAGALQQPAFRHVSHAEIADVKAGLAMTGEITTASAALC